MASHDVWGVWVGQYESSLDRLFTTKAAAERYADDYNRKEVANMNEHFQEMAQRCEAEGNPARAARYREQRWEPQAFVVRHTVYEEAPPDA